MTQRIARTLIVLAAVAVTALGLSGCAPATTTGSVANTTAPGSTKHSPVKQVPPALDTTAPTGRLNLPCTSLVTPAEVTGWQGAGVTLVAPSALAAGDLTDADNQLPMADYVREAGGIECLWAGGPYDHYGQDGSAVPPYLEITVQFDAASAWALNALGLGAIGNQAGECDGDSIGRTCQLDDLVGTSTWVEIISRKATGTAQDGIQAIENSVLAAIPAAGTPTVPTTPQTGTTPLGTQCTDFVSAANVQSALGLGTAVAASTPAQGSTGSDPQTPVWFASQELLKDHPCVFSSGSIAQAEIAWIPGGAWAWAENKTQPLADAPLQSLHLTGLGVHDTASIRCSSGDASCIVDLVLGGNWIESTVPITSTAANKRSAATALAGAILAKVGP